MSNDDIASVLQETADLLELTGGNEYRARAFSRAARSLSGLDDAVADRLEAGTLVDINGIGDAMADHVADILHGGSFELRDELHSAVPPGLMDVMQVQGLGTKRTRRLWTELDVTSLDELEQAAEEDRITTLDGFGPKTQQNILNNLRQLRRYESKWRLADAWAATQSFLDRVQSLEGVDRAAITGALRRQRATVEQAEVLVATSKPEGVHDRLASHLDDPSQTDAGLAGHLAEGVPVQVHVAALNRFGTAWWRTTGSSEHCTAVEDLGGAPGDHETEAALYRTVGLPVVSPVLREGQGEVEAGAADQLPSLLSTDDLDGCLHNHSTYSDGANSLRAMAEAARERGFSYFGICDHSQSLQIASGLSPDEVRDQRADVDRLNEEFSSTDDDPFRVFHGIESDILGDGSLDYETDVLDTFDFVVASVHTGFSMTADEATDRLVRAIENPYTRILGHPTGRLLLRREGYPIDHERVIEACAEHDVALELNANPHRLDLDWRWVRTATDHGVLISINPDAHALREIDYVKWGVAVGRKGWLTPDQCLNAKSLEGFVDWLDDGAP
ncbi:MAG: DNA polymerase/3'-5' exonuclease PolX [Bacteroidetes bacterium SW_11_64_17]|nr:MAG: DNA polymerase/3'-5' exonuclease PolX [Bacteroidetes bacterium SW_11_64_17]